MIEISITLFMKPEDEIDIDYASSEKFRHFGSYLKEKMYYIADLIDNLENKNWSRSSTLYDIRFIKDMTPTKSTAAASRQNINAIGKV